MEVKNEKTLKGGVFITFSGNGSDLVHDEGRKIGNDLSVFLPCKNAGDRKGPTTY